jgi:hypothetical protein
MKKRFDKEILKNLIFDLELKFGSDNVSYKLVEDDDGDFLSLRVEVPFDISNEEVRAVEEIVERYNLKVDGWHVSQRKKEGIEYGVLSLIVLL